MSSLDNPLFPIALGGLAAATFYFFSKGKSECHKRTYIKQQRALQGKTSKHPYSAPLIPLSEVVGNSTIRPEQMKLLRVERGINGSNKLVWQLPNGQLFFSYNRIARHV